MNDRLKRCFDILDISPETSYEQAKVAYRLLVQVWHPDKHSHNEKLNAKATSKIKEINAAWSEIEGYFKNCAAEEDEKGESERRQREQREKSKREEKVRQEGKSEQKSYQQQQQKHQEKAEQKNSSTEDFYQNLVNKKTKSTNLKIIFFIIAAVLLIPFFVGKNIESPPTQAVFTDPKQAPLTKIVVAAKDLDIGTLFDENNLGLAEWPIDQVPKGAFSKIDDAIGRVAITEMVAGQPLRAAEMASEGRGDVYKAETALLRPGYRAVTVLVDNTSILPGSYVDVVKINSGRSTVILENIRVLAVARDASIRETNVNLEVTPKQAETLIGHSLNGSIDIILRNHADFSSRN